MIFEDNYYNNPKYEFNYYVKNDASYSYTDVCKALYELTNKIYNANDPIYLHCKSKFGDVFQVNNVKESTYFRDENDIHNIIVRKSEFRKKLEILHIYEPVDISGTDFVYYLQFVYFFYIMTYFVFPDVKFFDLFKEKNWSSENTFQAEIGNEIYELFILDNLYEDSTIKSIYKNKLYEYDQTWSHCVDGFFDYYNRKYPFNTFNKTVSSFFTNLMNQHIDQFHDEIYPLCTKEIYSRNVFDSFFDFNQFYNSKVVNMDFLNNTRDLDYKVLLDIYKHIQRIPETSKHCFVTIDELDQFVNSEEFISICMNIPKLTNTILNKYNSFEIKDTVLKIWNFEKEQLFEFPDSEGFTFIYKYKDEYVMDGSDILIIAMCRIYIPYTLKYYSKRIDLHDRSDSSKKTLHSIKESFKVVKQTNMIPKLSTLRDAFFRIICKMEQSLFVNGNANEFLYFEVPMNTQVFRIMDYAECLPTTEQRTLYFKLLQEKMAK